MLAPKNQRLIETLQTKLKIKRPSARSYASLIRRLHVDLKQTGPLSMEFLNRDATVKHVAAIDNVGRRKNQSVAALAGTRAADHPLKRQNEYRSIMLSADADYKRWASSGTRQKGFSGDAAKLWQSVRNLHKKIGRIVTAKNLFKRKEHTYEDLVVLQQFVYAKLLSGFEPRRLELSSLRFLTPDQLGLFTATEKKLMNYILMTPKRWQLVYNHYKTSRSYGSQTYSVPPGLKTTLKKIQAVFAKRVPEGWIFFNRNNRPMSHSSFSKFIKTVFSTYMGKPYTQNVIRSIRVSSLFKDAPSTKALLEAQAGMGSNLATLALNYRVPQKS